jgi:DHA1 family bicyclomycin/chloramphenicol resistance-like MFS transporter
MSILRQTVKTILLPVPTSLMFCLMAVLVALVDMASDLYIPVLPEIGHIFRVSESWVGATLSINLISLAFSGLYYGSLSDSIGRRPVIIGGILLFMLASFACGVSTNIIQLLIARFFQGLGGGVAFSVGVAVVRDLYEGSAKSAQMFSRMQSVIALSPTFAPIIGGIIGAIYGWESIFYVLGIIALALLMAMILYGKETLPLEKRRKRTPASFSDEYKYFLKRPLFWCYAGIQILSLGWFWSELAFLPALFQDFYEVPASSFGWYLSVLMAAYIFGTFLNQYLVNHVSLKKLVNIGLGLFFLSAIAMCIVQVLGFASPWMVVLLRFPAGIGFAFVFGNAATLAMDQEKERTGSAAALIGSSELLAGAIGIFIIDLFGAGTLYPLALMIIVCSIFCVAFMVKAQSMLKRAGQ